ncbi:MAG: type I restriction-modification enzyme R subunit C-terminal domain-containing protein [Actinomycetota bacterium]
MDTLTQTFQRSRDTWLQLRYPGAFTPGSTTSGDRIEFINPIVEHLTHHGIMDPSLLYESPFTDINSQGPEGVFNPAQLDQLVSVLDNIRVTAA